AAVPGVAGVAGAAALDQTQVLGTEDATRVMPSLGTAAAVPPTTTRKRNPWTWPLIALIGILLLVLIGTVIALFSQGEDPVEPPPTTPVTSTAPEPTETETPEPTEEPIVVNLEDYVGRDAATVRTELSALGLQVTMSDGGPPPT